MIILVLNCGSSSIKYQLFNMQEEGEAEVIAKGIVERIGLNDALLNHKPAGKEKYKEVTAIPDHTVGINMVFKALTDEEHGVIKDTGEINAVGHRVVQGGEKYTESVLITKEVIKDVEENSDLAPL